MTQQEYFSIIQIELVENCMKTFPHKPYNTGFLYISYIHMNKTQKKISIIQMEYRGICM